MLSGKFVNDYDPGGKTFIIQVVNFFSGWISNR
jgi:hypothetical protein